MATKFWIFDLDNTLHNATPHIFPHINRSMTAYLQEHLQLDEAEANDLRMHYWQRYGATLSGLIRHHGTESGSFPVAYAPVPGVGTDGAARHRGCAMC